MALINCPECNKEISDKVKACPHCGYPLVEDEPQKVELSSVNLKKMPPNTKKKFIIIASIICAVIVLIVAAVFIVNTIKQNNKYEAALELYDNGSYLEAKSAFEALGDYNDSENQALLCQDKINLEQEKIKSEYAEKFKTTAAKIYLYTLLAELRCYMISEAWDNAIDDRDDFNIAIQELIQSWEDSGSNAKSEEYKAEIDTAMKELQNPVEEYTNAYDSLVEMYGLYIQINEQSTSPSGSLITFNSNINDLASQFEKVYNQILIIMPDVQKEVEEEKQNFDFGQ